ncbi:MAG: aspartate 1-decarboxylase [Desulfovibrionaceae bacterium]|nr:aspartate 1-decarboxylase [Desulfovibrionaceae bacterium]
MIEIVRAKLHGIHVTGCELEYHGSVSLDPEVCQEAGICPLEFVYIWNKNTGERISTYVIYGEPGSRCCILNGAAARTCQKGDTVIICASEYVADKKDICAVKPVVLTFDQDNSILERLQYDVQPSPEHGYSMQIRPLAR